MGEIIVRILTSNPFLPLEKMDCDTDIFVDYDDVEYISMQEDKKNIRKDFQNIGKDIRTAFEEYSNKYELAF
ncbi:MAG: hypothetical protein IJ180_09510 [Bacteroidales bacterium]|nr:hypothetical protein [Bacteroidales bacterium]